MLEWNPQKIITLLKDCGRIALEHYESPQAEFKGDRSLVTQADRSIEGLMASRFDRPEEGSFFLGEETIDQKSEDYIEKALRQVAWVVDPIDGTAPYVHHIPTWGISIGMMRGGQLEEGAIYLPATRELFLSQGDRLYYSDTVTVHDAGGMSTLRRLPVHKPPFDDGGMIGITQGLAKGGKINLVNPVQVLGSLVISMTYLCLGRYLAIITAVNLWDLAGVLPIVLKAGFTLRLRNGHPVGTGVNETVYRLAADSKRRWRMRDVLIAAGSEEIVRRVSGAIDRWGS